MDDGRVCIVHRLLSIVPPALAFQEGFTYNTKRIARLRMREELPLFATTGIMSHHRSEVPSLSGACSSPANTPLASTISFEDGVDE
jgi:hypothetical protein